MPNHHKSDAQTSINISPECQAVIDIASHQALFGTRLDSIEHKASALEEAQSNVEVPAIVNATDQVFSEKSALAKLDQQSLAAIYRRLAELEMFLMIGALELVEVPCNRNDS